LIGSHLPAKKNQSKRAEKNLGPTRIHIRLFLSPGRHIQHRIGPVIITTCNRPSLLLTTILRTFCLLRIRRRSSFVNVDAWSRTSSGCDIFFEAFIIHHICICILFIVSLSSFPLRWHLHSKYITIDTTLQIKRVTISYIQGGPLLERF